MLNKSKILSLGLCAALLIIPGCGTSKTAMYKRNKTSTKTTASVTAKLKSMQANAVDLMNSVTKKDWKKAKTKLTKVKKDLNSVKPMLKRDPAASKKLDRLTTTIIRLDKNIKNKKPLATKTEANKVTGQLPSIADHLNTSIPTDLDRIQYLGRNIILSVEKKDFKGTVVNYNKIKPLWNSVKPKLSKSSINDSVKFDSLLNKLSSAIRSDVPANITKSSTALIRQVDVIKKDFQAHVPTLQKQNKKSNKYPPANIEK